MRARNIGFIMIALVVTCIGAYTLNRVSEIDMHEYRTLRIGFKQGTGEYRAAIAEAMQNGEVSRGEYESMMVKFDAINSGLPVEHTATSLREERLVLAAMTRQLQAQK